MYQNKPAQHNLSIKFVHVGRIRQVMTMMVMFTLCAEGSGATAMLILPLQKALKYLDMVIIKRLQ